MLKHPTFLVTALNVFIIALLAYIGWVTTNPLVILGLLLLQQTPVVGDVQEQLAAMGLSVEGEEEPGEYDGGNAGFNAKLQLMK